MSNFFEQELRKLFGNGEIIRSPSFTGRACLGTLGKDLRVRAQFVTSGYADHYDTLKITILNRTDGPVDTLALKLSDVWGTSKKDRSGNAIHPYIWVYRDEIDWYIYRPTQADWKNLREAVKQYLEPFRDMERAQDGPKLVYICAPLRGEVEMEGWACASFRWGKRIFLNPLKVFFSGANFKMVFADAQIDACKVAAITGKGYLVSVTPDCESLLV